MACLNIAQSSIFVICVMAYLQQVATLALYDFGENYGDQKVKRGRDVTQAVEFNVNFLRMPFDTVYVSTKGAILFDTPANPQSRMIAPFYADIDNRKKGRIWYRHGSRKEDLSRASDDIATYFPSRQFEPTEVLVVTWEDVPIQRNRGLSKGITFQAVIITDQHFTFTEFIYGDNKFPRARAIPRSPVIGFSSSDADFFDYAVAEETAVAFEKTKSSNVNEEGLWAFQIDGIDPYDIVWGVPAGGIIQGDDPEVFNDADTDLNIDLGVVGDDCTKCSADGSSCIDYVTGSCCVCTSDYMGNGKTCLRNATNKPYRANGVITGRVNGEDLSGINVHAFIVATEGRTYTAISPTPPGLNYTLQFLIPLAETIGWLFAVPKNKGINGITATGGTFTSSSRLRFSTGEELTIQQEYMTSGENIRNNIDIQGNLPVLTDKVLRVEEHSQVFTRHRPGMIHSFEDRTLTSGGRVYSLTLEQTINYEDCLADEADFDPILNSMSLQFSYINAFHEDAFPNLRFSMRSSISPTSELVRDPCESNNCDRFATCLPDADSYRCECFDGYTGDGFSCEEEVPDPCEFNNCSPNADCFPDGSSYICRCRSGYIGNGFTCEEEFRDPCESNRCDANADCIPDGSSYSCRCRFGFEGNGFVCEVVRRGPCDVNRCHTNAVCIPDGLSYYCQCEQGYVGDGFTCEEERPDPCESNRCDANADCYPDGSSYTCRCRSGFEGNGFECEAVRRGPCDVNRCHANAVCIPEGLTYYCQCEPGYVGDGFDCEEETTSNPCIGNRCDVNAVCFPDGNGYVCECVSGFEGNGFVCEEIFMDPCHENDCNPFARCIPYESVYDCECLEGYEGDGYLCTAFPCRVNNCDVNADCFASADGRDYQCQCKAGYQGDGFSCEATSVDVCEDNDCHPYGECIPVGNRYDCQCLEGFLGDGFYCISEDPCFDNRCDENAECSAVGESYQCTCNPGYEGNGYSCSALDCSSCDANALCVPDGGGFRCECNDGFDGNGQICEDINECFAGGSSPCDPNAYCDNTFGSFVCSCREGFAGDGTYCQVAVRPSGDGMLVYGQGMAVMKMPLDPSDKGSRVIHKKRQTIVGLAYDCVDEMIYFTDVAKGSISRVKPDGTEYKRLIKKGLSSPEGVAVDHLSRNLYWTDSGFDCIEVSSLDGRNRRVIIKTDLVNPRAIVADPISGYLYWTDWNREDPKIERSFMDGEGREVLVKDGLRLPNGLTLDQVSQKICWADAGSEKVECISVSGNPLTRTTVFSQADYPFGLAAFDQNLYWTDWTDNAVFAVNKNGALSANEMSLPQGGVGRLNGIIAAQECVPGSNACTDDNGGCSALCLPLPRGERTCACNTDARGNEIPC